MPAYEIPLPVGATNPKITCNGKDYFLVIDTDTFTRAGADGNDNILPLFGGDEFVGTVLEGQWHKFDDGVIAGPTTALISDGSLEITGKSAGDEDYAWLRSSLPMPFLDELTIDVHFELDGGADANTYILNFYLNQIKNDSNPDTDANLLRFYLKADTSSPNYYIRVGKEVGGSFSYVTADIGVDSDEGTLRIKFQEKSAGHTHFYWAEAPASIDETTDEIAGSPFALGLDFDVGYPGWVLQTADTTEKTCKSDGISVSYPNMAIKYDVADSDRNKGEVELWDTNGSETETDWQRVFDEDHSFTGDAVIQNGLVRFRPFEGVNEKFKGYHWTGAAWNDDLNLRYHHSGWGYEITYAYMHKIVSISPDQVVIQVKTSESTLTNNFVQADYTLERGSYILHCDNFVVNPLSVQSEPNNLFFLKVHSTDSDVWAYVGDDTVGDRNDLVVYASNSAPTSDNWMQIISQNDGVLITFGQTQQPTSRAYFSSSIYLANQYFGLDTYETAKASIGIIPFAKIANVFKEAEAATISADSRSYLDGQGNSVDSICEAQGNRVDGVKDGAGSGFWGSLGNATVSDETTYGLNMDGSVGTKVVVHDPCPGNYWFIQNVAGGQDWSGEDFVGFWWYGKSSGDTFYLRLVDGVGPTEHSEGWTDDYTGWRYIAFPLSDYSGMGVSLADIQYVQIRCISTSGSVGETYYQDIFQVFTIATDSLWSVTVGGGSIDTSSQSSSPVGSYDVKLTTEGASGANTFTCTPVKPLGNLLKFDSIKFWAKTPDVMASQLLVFLHSSGGGECCWKAISPTGDWVEYTLDMPYSNSDLQGWTNCGTDMDFSDFTHLSFYCIDGGVERIYLDGIRFFIDTTTDRERDGEAMSGDDAVVLDTQNEWVRYIFTAGDDLSEGRYLGVIRAKDTDQVASDAEILFQNQSDSQYRNQENVEQHETVTGAFAYYCFVVDIKAQDVTDTDTFVFNVKKDTATENTIFIDYFLLIPIGDGMSFPQDVSHNALRSLTQSRRIFER